MLQVLLKLLKSFPVTPNDLSHVSKEQLIISQTTAGICGWPPEGNGQLSPSFLSMPMFAFNLCWSLENGKFSTKAELKGGKKPQPEKGLVLWAVFSKALCFQPGSFRVFSSLFLTPVLHNPQMEKWKAAVIEVSRPCCCLFKKGVFFTSCQATSIC